MLPLSPSPEVLKYTQPLTRVVLPAPVMAALLIGVPSWLKSTFTNGPDGAAAPPNGVQLTRRLTGGAPVS